MLYIQVFIKIKKVRHDSLVAEYALPKRVAGVRFPVMALSFFASRSKKRSVKSVFSYLSVSFFFFTLPPSLPPSRLFSMKMMTASSAPLKLNGSDTEKSSNGRKDVMALKQQLADCLGDNGPLYWDALRDFVMGKLNRQEFDFYANLYLSRQHGKCRISGKTSLRSLTYLCFY